MRCINNSLIEINESYSTFCNQVERLVLWYERSIDKEIGFAHSDNLSYSLRANKFVMNEGLSLYHLN